MSEKCQQQTFMFGSQRGTRGQRAIDFSRPIEAIRPTDGLSCHWGIFTFANSRPVRAMPPRVSNKKAADERQRPGRVKIGSR
jgi:hypothetical protein